MGQTVMTLNFAAVIILLALPSNEAICHTPNKTIPSTKLKGNLVTYAVWYPVPIHLGVCQKSHYPDTIKRRSNRHRLSVIIGTDDKNYVVEYVCLDTGKYPRIETVVYTKKQSLKHSVIKEIVKIHSTVGLDYSKIWYCQVE
ncbi:uncharacterized protein LOC108163916 [Drosophila miranda]|uniref:uncharacterized protein LOC108163916 n=1 Tax=Drosophila miranda TaxID=7229 RepID=UPI00143F1276|nr:uncharacterized protein LOC108163916 [Drosophila miranda]